MNLFRFIRGLWHKPPIPTQEPEEKWINVPWFINDWYADQRVSHQRTESLTEKELQLLRNIVVKHIRAADQVKKQIKDEALSYEVGDALRGVFFREHREIKEYLKKLSALQYRLKYKIQTKG